MRRLLLIAVLLAATPALAASPDAWEEFRVKVKTACLKKAAETLVDPTVWVDPFGTESYGVAIAKGLSKYDKAPHEIVCVFDKKTEKVEATPAFKR